MAIFGKTPLIDHYLSKFIGTKGSVYIRKEFNSPGQVWKTNTAALLLFWNTNMAAVTSCENSLSLRDQS